jgi:hypothetical protein
MGTTTSNQKLGITTKTSGHIAKTEGATDVCFDPPKKVPKPHPNEVPTERATEHTSDKTKFSEGNVVREGDAIGPLSDPAHGDSGGGVVSGTYRYEARVTTGSPNVKTEGKPVGRNTDPTTQNHGNTTGKVTGGDPNKELTEIEAEKLLACSLDTTKVTCSHGREAGKEHLLEVTAPDTLTLVATRKNAKTGGAPACTNPPHTKWIVTRYKSGKEEKKEEKPGDTITLDNSWFTWGSFDGGQSGPTYSTELEAKDNTKQLKQDALSRMKPKGNKHKQQQQRARANREAKAGQAAIEGVADQFNTAVKLAGAAVSLVEFFIVWNAEKNPVEVNVQALACSGGDKYIVRSYPGKEVEFSLDADTKAKIQAAAKTIEKICKAIKYVASLGGVSASAEIKIFQSIEFSMSVKWEEMTQDVAAIRKYKHHCDRGWSFQLGGQLLGIDLRFGVPVAAFANAFIPGAGTALTTALSYIGLEAKVEVRIDIDISANVFAEREPGALSPTVGGQVTFTPDIFFAVVVQWRSALEIAAGAVVKTEVSLQLKAPTIDLFAAYFNVEKGEISLGLRGTYKVDFLWWKKSDTFEYFPEAAKYTWDEFQLKVLSALRA